MNILQQWLAAPWVEPLGRTLLHFLWQGAALGALAWGALRLAHKRTAHVRYLLAGVLILALPAMPVATYLILSHAPNVAKTPGAISSARLANAIATTTPLLLTAPGGENPTANPTPTPQLSPAAKSAASIIPANPAMRLSWLADTIAVCSRWMVPFWVIGVLAMGGRLGLGWLRIQFWRRAAAVAGDSAVLASFKRLVEKFNAGARVRLLISKTIPGPVTLGWLRPAVLLPAQLLTGLPPEMLEALLAHELAHITRRDYLANLVQSAIEVVLFYHPVVWWLGARLREIREECCDELAVQACGDRLAYARALESLAELQLAAEPAAAANGGNLLARISRIVGRAPETAGSSAIGTLLFLVALGGLIACHVASPSQPRDQTPSLVTAPPSPSANPNPQLAQSTAAPSQSKEVEVEITLVDYPSSEQFAPQKGQFIPPVGAGVFHMYMEALRQNKNFEVIDVPKATFLEGPQTTRMIVRTRYKGIDGQQHESYSLLPASSVDMAGNSTRQSSEFVTFKWELNGSKMDFSGKVSLIAAGNEVKSEDGAAQHSDLTEIAFHGETIDGQINLFRFGNDKSSGRSEAAVIVLNRIDPSSSLAMPALTPPPKQIPGSAPHSAQTPMGSAPTGTLRFGAAPAGPVKVQWNGNFTFAGNSSARPLPDSLKVITTDALTGQKLANPAFDSEWSASSSTISIPTPITSNTLIASGQTLRGASTTHMLVLSGNSTNHASPPAPDPVPDNQNPFADATSKTSITAEDSFEGTSSTVWVAPLIQWTDEKIGGPFGDITHTVRWYNPNGTISHQLALGQEDIEVKTANGSQGHTVDNGNYQQGSNYFSVRQEDGTTAYPTTASWSVKFPSRDENIFSVGAEASADGSTFVRYLRPTAGKIAIEVYTRGKMSATIGPYLFDGHMAMDCMGDDGSLAFLTQNKPNSAPDHLVVLTPQGKVSFEANCPDAFQIDSVAPGGRGALLTNSDGNFLGYFTPAGRSSLIRATDTPQVLHWLPDSETALVMLGKAPDLRLQLYDFAKGAALWEVPCPLNPNANGVWPSTLVEGKYIYVCGLDSKNDGPPGDHIRALNLSDGQWAGSLNYAIPDPSASHDIVTRFQWFDGKPYLISDSFFKAFHPIETKTNLDHWDLPVAASDQPDPNIRHNVTIQVPTKLKIERGEKGLVVYVDDTSSAPVQVSVGKNMKYADVFSYAVYHVGDPNKFLVSGAGSGGYDPNFSTTLANPRPEWLTSDTIPDWSENKLYVVEFEFCLMEASGPFGGVSSGGMDDSIALNENAKDFRILYRKKLSVVVNGSTIGPKVTYGPNRPNYDPPPENPIVH